uniref:N-methyl transferase n=1 Tax=Hapalosiphon welwitschii UH IC-52-3 TaxID=1524913 RepID=A0A075X5R0_9CYAN|nr:N-methyl transferase [Hapalosiphon welwitschii UH IC-52-3]
MLSQEKPSTVPSIEASQTMLQMIMINPLVTRAIYAAAKLGIADLLKYGIKSYEELADAVSVKPLFLYRLLRALASLGVFAEEQEGYFTLTPLANCLVSDIPGSLRALTIINNESELYQVRGNILYSLQNGCNAFEHLYGMPLFEYYIQNPELGKTFDEAMTSVTAMDIAEIIANYDFSKVNKLVDVGAGQGKLLASILKAYPTCKGVLYELPSVSTGAVDLIKAEGLQDRCEIVGGNFLESVPAGGDVYMIKSVIHNWDDENAITILKNCHRGMKENGKLLVVEAVIQPGNKPCAGKFHDLAMMLVLNGRERTEKEYQALFEASGFQLTRIIPTMSLMSVIEGVRIG